MSRPDSARKLHADAILGGAASAILLAMMLLTVVDVVARYVFNRPLRGAFEISELMLVILIFAGLPLVSGVSLAEPLAAEPDALTAHSRRSVPTLAPTAEA